MLEFGLTPTSCDDYEVKTIFELFYRDLRIDNNVLLTTTQVRSRLFNSSKLFHKNNLKKLERNLPKSELSALHKFSKNTGLVIVKPDKGNGVVILKKNDYNTKSLDILSDSTKFRVLQNDTLDSNENKLNRILRKLLKQGHITHEIYDDLFVSGSRSGFFYGLPKIHKPNAPLRPII